MREDAGGRGVGAVREDAGGRGAVREGEMKVGVKMGVGMCRRDAWKSCEGEGGRRCD